MTFSDIFKASFLERYSSTFSTEENMFFLCVAAVIGFYIFLVYRIMTRKCFYNKAFNVSLWFLTVIVTAIIITISSNIVMSLGMVGALSIVRYRTAIKDPLDLVFLFWAITEGIICGAGIAVFGMILAVILTIGLLVLNRLPFSETQKIFNISCSSYDCEDAVLAVLDKFCKSYKIEAKTASAGQLNFVITFTSKEERACMDALLGIENVFAVSSLTHNGEITV